MKRYEYCTAYNDMGVVEKGDYVKVNDVIDLLEFIYNEVEEYLDGYQNNKLCYKIENELDSLKS